MRARPIRLHFREPDGLYGRPPHMHNAFSAILGVIAPLYLEDECRRCFRQNAPKQPSFAEATRQAQKLLSAALNTH